MNPSSNSIAHYPETGFGYIPDGGSIYLLSRMIGEVGVFLALTGYKLKSGNMQRLKISDGSIDDLELLKEHLTIMLNERNLNYSVSTADLGFNTFEENYKRIKISTIVEDFKISTQTDEMLVAP